MSTIPKQEGDAHHKGHNHGHAHEHPQAMTHEHGTHGGYAEHREHGTSHEGGGHARHEGHSVEGFRKRFWFSLILTVPVVVLSPMLQHWAGLADTLRLPAPPYPL